MVATTERPLAHAEGRFNRDPYCVTRRSLCPRRLVGAAVVVIGAALRLPATALTIAGAVLCFGLRFMAIRRGWHLLLAEGLDQLNTKARAPNDRKNDGARRR